MKKAVIFDLDDTLTAEDEYIQSGYRAVAEYLAAQYLLPKEELYTQMYTLYHHKAANVFNQLLDAKGISYTVEDIKKLVQIYRNHIPSISCYDDVLPVLNSLRDKGIKIGMISDGYSDAQRNKIAELGLKSLFDKIILTDELGRDYWKPDSRSFLMMREAFGVSFQEMIYVGDNPEKDFYIGMEYPILTVRIKREKGVYLERRYLDDVKEKAEISSLFELLSLVEE